MHFQTLQLAGTVALPPPFPSVGLLKQEQVSGGPSSIDVLTIKQHIGASRSIVRAVKIADIVGVFVPTKPDCPGDLHAGEWVWQNVTDASLLGAASQAKQPLVMGLPRGIVFVPEHAPVVTQDESGTTAAESAEYMHGPLAQCCPSFSGCCP